MYRPLPNYLTIKQSGIEGLGLFTTKDIDSGHVLGITHVEHMSFENGYIRTPLGGFYNHVDDNPNCKMIDYDDGMLRLKALRDIKNGEEITVTYNMYNPNGK